MHLILPIIAAVGFAVYARKKCMMTAFFIASIVAAALIGMEIQEGIDK